MESESPNTVAEQTYGMQWLRPMLWIGMVLGVFDLVYGCLTLLSIYGETSALRRMGGALISPEILIEVVTALALPLCLILGPVRCLKLSATARLALLIYCWAVICLHALRMARLIFPAVRSWDGLWLLDVVRMHAHQIAFPVILLLLLTRAPIRHLFVRRVQGFDVVQ